MEQDYVQHKHMLLLTILTVVVRISFKSPSSEVKMFVEKMVSYTHFDDKSIYDL